MAMTAVLAKASMEERIYMTDAVKAEIRRQQAHRKAEDVAKEERAKMQEIRCVRLMTRDLAVREYLAQIRPPLGERIREAVTDSWALVAGSVMVYIEEFAAWGVRKGLLIREDE